MDGDTKWWPQRSQEFDLTNTHTAFTTSRQHSEPLKWSLSNLATVRGRNCYHPQFTHEETEGRRDFSNFSKIMEVAKGGARAGTPSAPPFTAGSGTEQSSAPVVRDHQWGPPRDPGCLSFCVQRRTQPLDCCACAPGVLVCLKVEQTY